MHTISLVAQHTQSAVPLHHESSRAVNASERIRHQQRGSHRFITPALTGQTSLPMTRPETHQNLIHNFKRPHAPHHQSKDQLSSNTNEPIRPHPPLGVMKTNGPELYLLYDDLSAPPSKPTTPIELLVGGGERVRTDDPLLAKQVLSQLSYTPNRTNAASRHSKVWAREDLNLRPHAYQACALTS